MLHVCMLRRSLHAWPSLPNGLALLVCRRRVRGLASAAPSYASRMHEPPANMAPSYFAPAAGGARPGPHLRHPARPGGHQFLTRLMLQGQRYVRGAWLLSPAASLPRPWSRHSCCLAAAPSSTSCAARSSGSLLSALLPLRPLYPGRWRARSWRRLGSGESL